MLVANLPSLGNQPNFFNLCTLRNHFTCALKRIPCPQSTINGWSGVVLTPNMYALISAKPFTIEMELKPLVPDFPPIFKNNGTTIIPYTCEQVLKVTAKFARKKNYYDTACNIYHAVYDALDTHVDDAFKVAPSTIPPTIGWNASMSLNKIFDQLMKTYGGPTPDAMRQNMSTFLSPYNPQDPPKILFKQCADCQEIAIIANLKYTNQELLMNVINLLTQSGLYQCNLEDWDRKPKPDKTWINLCPFIREVYQRCLQSGTMTAGQGGNAFQNCFAGLTATDKEYVSGNYTAKSIAGTISSHFSNLSAQAAAIIEANTMQVNASLQQLANNNAQLQQQQQVMMQQMALLSTNAATPRNNQYITRPPKSMPKPIYRVTNSSTSREVAGTVAEVAAKAAVPVMVGGGGRVIPMPTSPFMGGKVIP